MNDDTPKTLTDVLTCLRELLRQIDAGRIAADDRQRSSLHGALQGSGFACAYFDGSSVQRVA